MQLYKKNVLKFPFTENYDGDSIAVLCSKVLRIQIWKKLKYSTCSISGFGKVCDIQFVHLLKKLKIKFIIFECSFSNTVLDFVCVFEE